MSFDFVRSGGLSVALDKRVHSWADGLPNTPNVFGIEDADTYGGYLNYDDWLTASSGTFSTNPATIWRTQPHVRTVIEFLAKNMAQLSAHAFTRSPNGDRTRERNTVSAKLMREPVPRGTSFEFLFNLVVDLCLWDRYAALVTMGPDGQWRIERVPPKLWRFHRDSLEAVTGIKMTMSDGSVVLRSLDNMIWIDAYPSSGSPMDALRQVLQEEWESSKYRADLWKNGARYDVIVRRPLEAPRWSKTMRDKFKASWAAGSRASGLPGGGTKLLEDSMEVQEVSRLSPHDAEQMQARKLAKQEICSFFGVDATLVGASDSANYSNVSAYSVINDTTVLSSMVVKIGQAFNTRLLPIIGAAPNEYLEFSTGRNRGNIENLVDTVQKATGGIAVLTPNEGRELLNRNRLDDPAMDKLVIPIYISDPNAGNGDDNDDEAQQ